MLSNRGGFRTANAATEQLVTTGRVRLIGILPELTTTGTITIRDGSVADASGTIIHVCAIGLLQSGKPFYGLIFNKGITVTQSVGTDQMLVVFEKF